MKTETINRNGYITKWNYTDDKIDIQCGSYRCLAFRHGDVWKVSFSQLSKELFETWTHHDAGTESLVRSLDAELQNRIDEV